MGQTSSKRSRQSARMRRRILEAAFGLIADKGIDKVSVREIVQQVKVSKPVLYYYFKNKNDLCEQMFEEGVSDFKKMFEGIGNASMPVEGIVAEILKRDMDFFRRNPKVNLLILRMLLCCHNKSKFAQLINGVRLSQREMFRAALTKAEKNGELPKNSTKDIMHLIIGLLNHFLINLPREPETFDSKLPQRLAKIIVSGARAAHGNR